MFEDVVYLNTRFQIALFHGFECNKIIKLWITQTTDGYLWLATWEGPVRYNGNNFKAFNRKDSAVLANAGIRNFTQAADGSVVLIAPTKPVPNGGKLF